MKKLIVLLMLVSCQPIPEKPFTITYISERYYVKPCYRQRICFKQINDNKTGCFSIAERNNIYHLGDTIR